MNSLDIVPQRLSNPHLAGNLSRQRWAIRFTGWLRDLPLVKEPSPTAHLLPNYDEYLVSYRNSRPVLDPAHTHLIEHQNPIFSHFLVIDGRMVGAWRRDFQKNTVIITLRRFVTLSEAEEAAVRIEAERFGQFMGMANVIMEQA
ncbi:MAG: winged helix DNA-binding domain-containing protein [Anaerolineales bacterium]|nr:winged helix DNA-binding domain-containing protein [Anaerolineales bacterium]